MKVKIVYTLAVLSVISMSFAMQERPQVYTMMDAALAKNDWNAVFGILEGMQGVFNINEYHFGTIPGTEMTLLGWAIFSGNLLHVKQLIEKYHADPNVPIYTRTRTSALTWVKEILQDEVMAEMLRQHGAK